jgi:hypothetical protein
MSITIDNEIDTTVPVRIGDSERRQGLYLLGRSGMGKTTLIENTILQDIKNGHGVFFLDPHGDAITNLVPRIPITPLIIDPENETHSFGINPLYCANLTSIKERVDTYTRTYNIFRKIWAQDWELRPWLQLIIQNTLYVFVENQDYTLAEMPLFLTDVAFRDKLLRNVKHNPVVVEFWQHRFEGRRREWDQEQQVSAALTRIDTLLGHPYVSHIIGQHITTINFSEIMEKKQTIFVKLSASLPEDIKKFIGIILINELLTAVRKRIELPESKRHQFCIFVDEFQHFASSEDFNTLFMEARKWGIASLISHIERFGQFADNKKIAGATAASVNKVVFQLTPADSI